jgi:hypothetical protein
MGKVLNPVIASRVGEHPEALADGSDAPLCLAIRLVVVGGGHEEINVKVLHQLLPKVGGEPWVSV